MSTPRDKMVPQVSPRVYQTLRRFVRTHTDRAVKQALAQTPSLVQAQVVAVNTSPSSVTIAIGGQTLAHPIPYAAHVSGLAAGQMVWCMSQKGDLWVIARIAP